MHWTPRRSLPAEVRAAWIASASPCPVVADDEAVERG